LSNLCFFHRQNSFNYIKKRLEALTKVIESKKKRLQLSRKKVENRRTSLFLTCESVVKHYKKLFFMNYFQLVPTMLIFVENNY